MTNADTNLVSLPTAAAQFKGGAKASLTHVVDLSNGGFRVLCGRVRAEHVLDDGCLAKPAGEATCPPCRRKLAARG